MGTLSRSETALSGNTLLSSLNKTVRMLKHNHQMQTRKKTHPGPNFRTSSVYTARRLTRLRSADGPASTGTSAAAGELESAASGGACIACCALNLAILPSIWLPCADSSFGQNLASITRFSLSRVETQFAFTAAQALPRLNSTLF
jgi:hypothetical protein